MLVNGQQSDSVSLLDRGLHYGDGLFETIAVIHGEVPLWHRHYQRLEKGCSRLSITVPEEQLLRDEIQQVADQQGHSAVKLIVTRGSGGRGYFPESGYATDRILMTRPWPSWSREDYSRGIRVHACEMVLASGSPMAGIKHLNRLEQVLAAREVEANHCREGVLCDKDGFLVEGVMSNLFWLRDGKLHTPLLDRCGVVGVMRDEVIEQAERFGFQVEEVRHPGNILSGADALFMTNALVGILPVREMDDQEFDVNAIPAELLDAVNRKIMRNDG